MTTPVDQNESKPLPMASSGVQPAVSHRNADDDSFHTIEKETSVTRNRIRPLDRRPLLSIGYFEHLPMEIIQVVFKMLDLNSLGILSSTSEAMRRIVWVWSGSMAFFNHHFPREREFSFTLNQRVPRNGLSNKKVAFQSLKLYLRPYLSFSILFKRMTFLMTSKLRMNLAAHFFNRVINDVTNFNGDNKWNKTLNVIKFVTMINAFIRGWDEREYQGPLEVLDKQFGLLSSLNSFLEKEPQELEVSDEIRLRFLMRSLVWDFADYGLSKKGIFVQKLFWLSTMRKYIENHCQSSSDKKQGYFLYLLFGPACKSIPGIRSEDTLTITPYQREILNNFSSHAVWNFFGDNIPADFEEGRDLFHGLSQAICVYTMKQSFDRKKISKLLDTMFQTNHFRRENVAGFLLFCSPDLIMAYLSDKMENCDVDFVSRMMMDLVIVSSRFENFLTPDKGITQLFEKICNFFVSKQKIASFKKAFWANLKEECNSMDLFMYDDEILMVLQSIGSFLMKRAYPENNKEKSVDVGELEE